DWRRSPPAVARAASMPRFANSAAGRACRSCGLQWGWSVDGAIMGRSSSRNRARKRAFARLFAAWLAQCATSLAFTVKPPPHTMYAYPSRLLLGLALAATSLGAHAIDEAQLRNF